MTTEFEKTHGICAGDLVTIRGQPHHILLVGKHTAWTETITGHQQQTPLIERNQT